MAHMTADNPDRNFFADCDNIEELLGQFAGAASMCWENIDGAGSFQDGQASRFVDAARDRLIELGWA